jgi:SulP family sulfate permease
VALFTAVITLLFLPFFSFLPMAVIAAILVNTALGLLETEKFIEYWHRERESFAIALIVALITIFHDAGLAVAVGAIIALLLFVSKIAHGRFDIYWNFTDGTISEAHGQRSITFPTDKNVWLVTYGIAGNLGYLDANRHRTNLKKIATSHSTPAIVLRLRNLFSIDFEGVEALAEAVQELQSHNIQVYISSANTTIESELLAFPIFAHLKAQGQFVPKTSTAIKIIQSQQ